MNNEKHISSIHNADQIEKTTVLLFAFCEIKGMRRCQGCGHIFRFYK